MKNIFLKSKAKSLQKTGGGDSQKNVHHLGVASEMPPRCLRDASVSIYSCQSDFSTRVWKYVACMLMVLCLGIGNVWGADPQDTYYKFTTTASANASIAPVSGDGGNITLGSNSAAKITASTAWYMGATYSYAININNTDAKSFSLPITASTENPAHVFVLVTSDNRTLKLKYGSSDVDQCSVRGTAGTSSYTAAAALVELVTTNSGSHVIYASGSGFVYAVRVAYEKNALWQEIKGLTDVTLDKDKTIADDLSTLYFFRMQDLCFNTDGVIPFANSVSGLRYSINFKAQRNGEVTVNYANPGTSSSRTLTVTEFTRPTTAGTSIVSQSVPKNTTAYADKKFDVVAGKEYVISFGASATIKSVNFKAACTKPAAPTALSCTAQTVNTLTFGWKKETNAVGYVAKLYSDSGCETEVDSKDLGDVNTVTFTGLSNSTTYYCKVQSKGNGTTYCEDGNVTAAANGTTETPSCGAVTAPTSLLVGATTADGVSFTIIDDADAFNYELYISESNTEPESSATATHTSTAKTKDVTGLTSGTTYYAWVRSVCDADHKSAWTAANKSFKVRTNPTASFANTNYFIGASAIDVSANFTSNSEAAVVYELKESYPNVTLSGSSFSATAAGAYVVVANQAGNSDYMPISKEATITVLPALTYLIENRLNITNGASWESNIYTKDDSKITNLSAFNPSRTGDGAINVNKKTANGSRSSNISSYTEENAENYMVLAFKVADDYALNVSAISVMPFSVGNEKQHRAWITDAEGNKIVEGTKTLAKDNCENVFGDVDFSSTSVSLTGVNYLKLWTWGNTDGYRLNTPIYIDGEIVAAAPASGHAITKSATNGTIAVTDGTDAISSAETGDKVYIAATPNTGYAFDGWSVYKTGDESTVVDLDTDDDADNKTRKFTMPAYGVTVNATFNAIDYTITHNAAENGSYTIKVADAAAVSTNTTANFGQTVVLAATPADGYKLSAWDVYKTGEPSTKVTVTNNQFTMPDYAVSVSATFAEATELYDYSVMENKSFTCETVDGKQTGKSKTFGSEGNPQLVVENAGWDSKDNIINSFIKFFGGTSSMSVVIPTGRKATVTIKYGSYNTGRYLLVNGTEQTHPLKALDNDITTSNIDTYMPTVELTNQTGTLVLTANGSNNIYIAYVDVTLTGNASYGVTYHLNDGAWNGDAGAATYTYGTGIATLATNVTRDYYDFAGWYGNEGLTGDAVTSIATSTTGDKEFWAAWTPKSYTLTWSWDGGACSATEGEDYTAGGSVAYGAAITYPEASTMSKENTAFAGWSTDAATMPAEALTITAQWAPSHAISYKEVKGIDVSAYPTTYVQGVGVASFEPLADVADFHFTGWSPASIGTDATEDVDVTAQWVAAYNVAFSAGEGSGTVPATFQKWATATFELPGQGDMVAPAGKVFVGWKANGAGETRAAGYEYTMTAAAVEFVAQWKAVTLLINYDGENYSINTSAFSTVVESLNGTHYTVNGVEYNKNFQFGNTASAVANVQWSNKFLAYDVKTTSTTMKLYVYNANNNDKILYYQIASETGIGDLQTETISSKGDGQVVTIDISSTKGTRIFFFVNSTDVRICQIEVTEEGTNLPAVGEVGYELAMKGRPFATGSSNLFTGSIDGVEYKLYSELRPINSNVYSVMRANDGTNYFKFTTSTNTQLQVTTSNNVKFYVLNNATTGDPDSDTQYGGSAATHNINLLASSNPYYIVPVVAASGTSNEVRVTKIAFAAAPDALTVTYKDGEDTYTTQNIWSGEKTTAPAAPTKSGYRFLGWLDDEENAFDFANTTISADLELHASWQKTWTVTFNADNGSDPAEVTVDNNTAVAAPDPAPEKAGNDFAGWYYGEPAAEYNFATLVTADLTLTAHWTPLDDDASISALAYNGNAIELAEGEEIAGVMTFHVLLPWGETPDKDLISVTKSAESATVGTISYESESKTASFTVTAGDHTTTADYAIVFANDVKKGASIIKATTNNVVTGLIGGSIDQSYSGSAGSRKLNKNEYFGIQLAEGNFQEGDVLIINITTPADLGNFMVYADAARTELLADQGITYTKPDAASPVVCPTGEMRLVLPAAVDGHNALYLSRENGNTQWNVTFSSLEVTREINPIIKSFKFGESAAAIDEEHKTISIDVPYGTDVTALTPTIEAYGNFGATYTPEGAQDFTSPVDYTITDGYSEFNTTYAVTVNVAAPSENAYLASLSVEGYALDFSKEVEEYDIVLDYGTTVLPTITYAVEDAGLAEAVKVEGGVNGATTITVTPQAGAGYEKVYTINFSVSTMPKFVIYDGSTMDAIAESGSDGESGFAWTIKAASKTNGESGAKSFDDKNYAKYVNVFTSATKAPSAGDARYMTITIPNGYLAKFRLVGSGNGDGSRSLFISKEITSTVDESIAYATTTSSNVLDGRTSDFQFPGTYYLCSNNSIRLYELSVTLYPINHSREVGEGLYGTICLPNGGIMVGATIYEVAHMTYENAQPYKLFFDEVLGGVMEAGRPYIFMPKEGVSSIAVTYTDEANAPAGSYNGLHGTLDNMNGTQLLGKYIFYNNMLFMSENEANWLNANRAYIQLNEVPDYVTPVAPNRRRVSMGFNGTNSATGIESISDEGLEMKGAQKMLINGKIYILRGEKMYDATGRLVK